MSDYWALNDPYCWPERSGVLRNRLGLKDGQELSEAETAFVDARAKAGLPFGRFSLTHYRACHRWLFGDLYEWAGHYRTVRLAKGQSVFCFPEHIDGQMRTLFKDLKANDYLKQKSRA
jgi:cell filamentation protein